MLPAGHFHWTTQCLRIMHWRGSLQSSSSDVFWDYSALWLSSLKMSFERVETSFKYNGIMLVLGMLQDSIERSRSWGKEWRILGVKGGGDGILGKKEKHNLQLRPQLGLNITLGEGCSPPALLRYFIGQHLVLGWLGGTTEIVFSKNFQLVIFFPLDQLSTVVSTLRYCLLEPIISNAINSWLKCAVAVPRKFSLKGLISKFREYNKNPRIRT